MARPLTGRAAGMRAAERGRRSRGRAYSPDGRLGSRLDRPPGVRPVAYDLVARRWARLRRRPVACGAGYGLLLYGIMSHVVVPRSAAGPGSRDPLWITLSIAAHVVLVGIPIALFVRRARLE